jgi:nucleotide-binding universal stress UspA family protein
MERVVVGVDFSEVAPTTVEWATRFVSAQGRLVLAHVVPTTRMPDFLRDLTTARVPSSQAAAGAALERLEGLARGLSLGSREVDARVVHGRPADALARLGQELEADLLVIGPKGSRAARLGTTAEQLVRVADRPVLVVHDPGVGDPMRLLLPIDSSPRSGEVLAWGRRLMEHFGARATVLHVLDHVLLAGLRAGEEGAWRKTAGEPAMAAAREWARNLARSHGLPDESTSVTAVFGSPVHEIAARTEAGGEGGHDLVVMGSRGVGEIRREIFGSVASGVLRAAWCPVMVV